MSGTRRLPGGVPRKGFGSAEPFALLLPSRRSLATQWPGARIVGPYQANRRALRGPFRFRPIAGTEPLTPGNVQYVPSSGAPCDFADVSAPPLRHAIRRFFLYA